MTTSGGPFIEERKRDMAVIWRGNDLFVLMVRRSQWKHLLAISLDVPAKEFIGHKHHMLF